MQVDLYHDCCMLANQIAQLNYLPRGGYFLHKAHVLFFSGHGTSRLHHSVSVSTPIDTTKGRGSVNHVETSTS